MKMITAHLLGRGITMIEDYKLFCASIKYGHTKEVNQIKDDIYMVVCLEFTGHQLDILDAMYHNENHPHYYEYRI